MAVAVEQDEFRTTSAPPWGRLRSLSRYTFSGIACQAGLVYNRAGFVLNNTAQRANNAREVLS